MIKWLRDFFTCPEPKKRGKYMGSSSKTKKSTSASSRPKVAASEPEREPASIETPPAEQDAGITTSIESVSEQDAATPSAPAPVAAVTVDGEPEPADPAEDIPATPEAPVTVVPKAKGKGKVQRKRPARRPAILKFQRKPRKRTTQPLKRGRRFGRSRWSKETRNFVFFASVAVTVIVIVGLGTTAFWGSSVQAGRGCDGCHAMRGHVAAHSASGHSSLSCAVCHSTPGPTGLLSDGLRKGRWILASATGGKVRSGASPDSTCRRCHRAVTRSTVEANGIRVRHSDFGGDSCMRCHSGTAHHLDERWYIGPQMDDCMSCHRSTASGVASCDKCHSGDMEEARVQQSSWRVSHGPTWQKTHGMGELKGCVTCHRPRDCERCHGVALPHPTNWGRVHGEDLTDRVRKKCVSCHETDWCTRCHGVEMPHPVRFLPAHGPEALRVGTRVCAKCHNLQQCDVCHYLSSHTNVPGVGMDTHGGVAGERSTKPARSAMPRRPIPASCGFFWTRTSTRQEKRHDPS